jgi:uncharacterized OB-fold protein
MTDTVETVNLAADALETGADGAPHLLGSRCADCQTLVFPPVELCPECMSENVARRRLSDRGTLYSWSVVHAAPRGWTVPYIAAYVDLPDGVRVFAHIVNADADRLAMDMTVKLCVAILGEDETGAPVESYAFTPADGGDG